MKRLALAAGAVLALSAGSAHATALKSSDIFNRDLRGAVGQAHDPSIWAMLIAGFAGGGAVLRRRSEQRTYRLVEATAHGLTLEEEFAAPDDASAFCRAASVASGEFQLWRGDILVRG